MHYRIGKTDTKGIKKKAKKMGAASIKAYALAAKRDSEPYVPRLSGDLRGSAKVKAQQTKAQLTYGGGGVPYARAHYYAPGNWNYTTAGTCPRWFDKAKARAGARWLQEAKAAVRVI